MTPSGVREGVVPVEVHEHECLGCGEVSRVPARYLGRTLRCPGCGLEFAVEEQEDDARGRSGAGWRLVVVGALVAVGLLALWIGLGDPLGVGSALFGGSLEQGAIATVAGEGSGSRMAALDRETGAELSRAAEERDLATLRSFREDARCLVVPAGTRVRVVEIEGRHDLASVRLLEDPWRGRQVWMPRRWLR